MAPEELGPDAEAGVACVPLELFSSLEGLVAPGAPLGLLEVLEVLDEPLPDVPPPGIASVLSVVVVAGPVPPPGWLAPVLAAPVGPPLVAGAGGVLAANVEAAAAAASAGLT